MRRHRDRTAERGVAAGIPGLDDFGGVRKSDGRPNPCPSDKFLPARRSRRTTISAGGTPCARRAKSSVSATRKSEGGIRGSAANDRGGRIQTGMAGLARQPGERAVAAHKTHNGARRSALGARRSALGARRSALGARRSALGARRSALGARRSALGARRSALGARRSALGARRFILQRTSAICSPSFDLGFYKTIRGPWQAPFRFPRVLTIGGPVETQGGHVDD